MSWEEVLAVSQRPSFEAAPSAARLRFLLRLRHAPCALLALLQVAGSDWRTMVFADLLDLQQLVPLALDLLPLPQIDSDQWLNLAMQYPTPWQQLIKRFLLTKGPDTIGQSPNRIQTHRLG